MSNELNDTQFAILDTLYFVESYAHILEDTGIAEAVVRDEIKQMVDKGWIHVYQFDEDEGDFVRTRIYDSDNMHEYHFLASKDGLLKHNGV